MNGLASPILRRGVALALLFAAILLTVSVLQQVLIDPVTTRMAEVQVLSNRLEEARLLAGRGAGLRRATQQASASLQGLDVLWPGARRSAIAAAMQDLLRSAARASRGQVTSSSALATDAGGPDIVVRARIEGTLETLRHVLQTVQTNRPLLFVDNLTVTAGEGASTPARPQSLSFELAVHGFAHADTAP